MRLELVTIGVICADVTVRPIDAMPPKGSLHLIDGLEMHMGGLASVAATVFSQLGGKSAVIGRLGNDSFGDYLLANLQKEGVDTQALQRDNKLPTSATVVLVDSQGERTFLHQMGANAVVSDADISWDFLKQARMFHWGGPGITPNLEGETMGRVMKHAQSLGIMTSMDTCYDGKGVWYPLIEPTLPHLDIVFSSFEEACLYTGKDTPETIAQFYLSFGIKIVVIKLGADGMYLTDGTEEHLIKGHQVEVIDTTGAGDASCGAFLFGLSQNWPLEKCGRLANAVGAITVQSMGGAEAVKSLEATLAFMDQNQ